MWEPPAIQKARDLGATPEDLELFQSTLDRYTSFSNSHPYWEGWTERVTKREVYGISGFIERRERIGGELNIDRLLVKIRDLAECFTTEDLKAFFLETFRDEVKLFNEGTEELTLFNVKWPQYFPEGPKQAPAKQEPKTKVLALRLFFLYRADYLPELDEGKGKKAALEAWAQKEGVSASNLHQNFNELSKRKPDPKKNPLKLSILEQVLPTLMDYPKALELAEEQLEELKRKK